MRQPISRSNAMSKKNLFFAAMLAVMFPISNAWAVIDKANDVGDTTSSSSSPNRTVSSTTSVKIKPADDDETATPSPPPPVLMDLQEQTVGESGEPETLGLQIRADAMREGALSYGARGGLAFRTFEIQRRLAEYDTSLSKTFDFTRLLLAAPSGFLIEPPVVSEAQHAVLVKTGGQAAAVADRIYHINRGARIVTAARNWRLYLERDWGKVDPPPDILLPKDDNERAAWREYVKEGWNQGIRQAEEIFEADIDRMTEDFIGMVRYRELLAQGMITSPFAMADNRGITGGGNDMRVGDRGVSITGPSQLVPRSNEWNPAPRQ